MTTSLRKQRITLKVMRGERFEGKKAFLAQIEPFFNEFKNNF